MLRATNIHWDCEDENISVFLPDEVDIPEDVEEEQVEDYLSDLVGYCVYSYNICEGFEY